MTSPHINYRSLAEENPFRDYNESTTKIDNDDDIDDIEIAKEIANDIEDTPRDSGVMIQIVPETSQARWNHIQDLDSFFTRMYNYQQKHGFLVIVFDEIFQVLEFVFVIWLLTFSMNCIKYDVLFGDIPPGIDNPFKTTLSDVIIPTAECVNNISTLTYILLFIATIYLFIRLFKMIYHITQYADIKKFYNTALRIEDAELDNITWHEVQQRIRKVQAEQHMCIDKEQLTELDIYHRILRFKNYLVALMNKQLLPVRFQLPVIGEVVSLSRGLLFNIDFILFRGPGSPFQNNWQLRDEFTVRSNQTELSQRLSKLILCVALVNLLLSPLIFLWQLIYFSFSYANILRKEPSALGLRTWSNYGRLYLRHFNELDHELDARLNRAYEYADRYLNSFSSPLMAVIARNLLFVSGGMLLLILGLGIYEEHVFQVEHMLTIITALTIVGLVCRTLIPDENMIWCPEQLMTAILAHVHYLPGQWKQQAHTINVRKEFSNFFQFKAGYLLNEIISPFITPFVLIFVFKPKSLEIVKFFRSFTVSVRGVGNVCSFAQMDVRKHGNPDWQVNNSAAAAAQPAAAPAAQPAATQSPATAAVIDDHSKQAESLAGGKTEMSLVHFTLNNPEWQMPKDASIFIKGIREHAIHELVKAKTTEEEEQLGNPLTQSLMSFGSIGEEYCSIANSVFAAQLSPDQLDIAQSIRAAVPLTHAQVAGSDFRQMLQQNLCEPLSASIMQTSSRHMSASVGPLESMRKMRLSKAEGRLEGPKETLLYSLYGVDPKLAKNPMGVTVADMCLSALYMHELSQQKRRARHAHDASIGEDNETPGGGGGGPGEGPSSSSSFRRYQSTATATPSTAPSGAGGAAGTRNTIVTTKNAAENTPLLGNVRS